MILPQLINPKAVTRLYRIRKSTLALRLRLGNVKWVFQIGAKATASTLRFWTHGLSAPMETFRLRVEEVAERIVGQSGSRCFTQSEVARILGSDGCHVAALCAAGEIESHRECGCRMTSAASLAAFLVRRWLPNFRPMTPQGRSPSPAAQG